MKKEVIVLMLIVFLIFSALVAAEKVAMMSKGVAVSSIDVVITQKTISNDEKRIIAKNLDEEKIRIIESKGCSIRHKFKDSVSFECEKEILEIGLDEKLDARPARIFQIVDLEAVKQIGADKVWNKSINGSNVTVAVLDSGIDSSHIELTDSIRGQRDFVNNDDIAEDDNGHGTHVAGIITANGVFKNIDNGNDATGVALGAEIYMLKVCNGLGLCPEDDIMAALDYIKNNLTDVKILSMSLGGGSFNSHCDFDPLAAEINSLVDEGILAVIAAGNNGNGVGVPACASKAVAVGATDKNGNVQSWSGNGPALDIVAPGAEILSTYSCLAAGNCNFYWYAYSSGTSMSTPHVAGVAALLFGARTNATVDEVKDAIYTTADLPNSCPGGCNPNSMGAGIVNAYKAFLAISPLNFTPDNDSDGIIDNEDNCPYDANPGQEDADNDNIGNVCDLCINDSENDIDGDGICADFDNCPSDPNINQTDKDNDGIGDVCDGCTDADNDNFCSEVNDCNDNDANINPNSTEICNNIDDNCNALIDENLIESFGSDVGECSKGMSACQAGEWVNVTNATYPADEICDNLDNNCDGIVDQIQKQCGIGTGVCDFGQQTCLDGVWGACLNSVEPGEEACNGLDDNCDGIVDNGDVCKALEINLFSPTDMIYNNRRMTFNITATEEVDWLTYIDHSDRNPRERSLCRNCDEYGNSRLRLRSFRDGWHNLTFKAIKGANIAEKNVSFFIDSRRPRILRTEPRRGFADGIFNILFNEDNPESLVLTYGNSFRNKTVNLSSCETSRGGTSCNTYANLTDFDGKEIEYWYTLEDIAGNAVESRHLELDVDITSPKINHLKYGINWRIVDFDIDIEEKNFDRAYYLDFSERSPRWRILCSRLIDNSCSTRRFFGNGFHNLTVNVTDRAGNYAVRDNIIFTI